MFKLWHWLHHHHKEKLYPAICVIIGLIIAVIGKVINTNLIIILIGSGIVIISLVVSYLMWIGKEIKIVQDINHKLSSQDRYYKNLKFGSYNIDFNKIKLIICDLDGTLLDHNGELSYVTRDILYRLQLARPDLLIVPATGREFFTTQKLLSKWITSKYLICNNGALLSSFNHYEVINDATINWRFVQSIFDYTLRHNIHALVFSDRGESLIHNTCVSENTWFYGWVGQYRITHTMLKDSSRIYQCGVWVPKRYEKKFRQFINDNICVEMYYYPHPDFTYFELTGAGVNKWFMIKKVCEREQISIDQVMAIGNGNNDIQMLAHVGVGVAVGNAEDVLLPHADVLIDPNYEDGVTKFLEYIYLQSH